MTTKLTLSVGKKIIDRAKRYAREHNKSLSEIVAKYLQYLTEDKEYLVDVDPEVLDLSDEIPIEELPEVKEAKYQYLKGKYLNE